MLRTGRAIVRPWREWLASSQIVAVFVVSPFAFPSFPPVSWTLEGETIGREGVQCVFRCMSGLSAQIASRTWFQQHTSVETCRYRANGYIYSAPWIFVA